MSSAAKECNFPGQQTFAFRYVWLEECVRGLLDHPDPFSREDALVLLDVGKNIVEAIRHWCGVTQVIEKGGERKKTGTPALKVSGIGNMLLRAGGQAPFLKDDAFFWLIHWLLASNSMIGTQARWVEHSGR